MKDENDSHTWVIVFFLIALALNCCNHDEKPKANSNTGNNYFIDTSISRNLGSDTPVVKKH